MFRKVVSKVAGGLGMTCVGSMGVAGVASGFTGGFTRYQQLSGDGDFVWKKVDGKWVKENTGVFTSIFDSIENSTHEYVRVPLDILANTVVSAISGSFMVPIACCAAGPMTIYSAYSPSTLPNISEILRKTADMIDNDNEYYFGKVPPGEVAETLSAVESSNSIDEQGAENSINKADNVVSNEQGAEEQVSNEITSDASSEVISS